MARFLLLVAISLAATPSYAVWLVLADGQQIQVDSVEIREKSVIVMTRAGKPWSLMRTDVDVAATLAANRLSEPLPVVSVSEPEPLASPESLEPPASPPPAPARTSSVAVAPEPPPLSSVSPPPPAEREPAPQTIIERQRAPLPPPSHVPPTMSTVPSSSYRFAITLNGVQAADAVGFTDTTQFELFKETAQIESAYSGSRARGFEIGAQFRIAGPIALGASVQEFDNTRDATYTASLPHPFFFDRFRELTGAASGLTYQETAFHVEGRLTETWGPLTVDAFGGPSWFETKTEILVDVLYDEVFPFDEVFLRGVEGRIIENRPLGFNVGASATFRVASVFGVDFGVRYSDARSNFLIEDGREIELDVGGLSFGAGLRFLFP